ncbi:MAG TPA: LuxR C-terminal-related transcriptional regulator [Bacteroidales bacterium]|nr:LuxR C-terminal-related transcriptional regulator [Bacteroidales bacterium]
MIFKNDQHIYLLKNESFDPSFLQNLAREKGYQVIELEEANELKKVLTQAPKKEPLNANEEEPLVFLQHIERKTLRDRFSSLFGYIQWLIRIMNDLKVGFMMSDGKQPLLISPLAREISEADPSSPGNHPIESILPEDQKKNFTSSIHQLSNGEIKQFSLELPIETPSKTEKQVHFYGKTIHVNHWVLNVEYLIEKKDKPSVHHNQTSYNQAVVVELHRILTALCGLTVLNLDQKVDDKNRENGKANERLRYNLTNREKQILKFIYEGHTSKQIAEKLYISKRTVESHRANILHKTNSRNTAELIHFAIGNNIL